MAFAYKVKEVNPSGKVVSVTYSAESREEVVSKIREKGHAPVSIERMEEASTTKLQLFKPKVKLKDLAVFCKQMSTMLHAGMPLIEALSVIRDQSDNKKLREVAGDMMESVQKGDILSSSMHTHDDVFPKILTNMVETGEMSGNLDDVLEKMAIHYTKENKIQSQVKGAMIYPAVIGVVALGAVFVLLTFVMPTFIKMFEGTGSELPAVTQLLLNISNFMQHYWYILLAIIFGIVFLVRRSLKTEKGKYFFDNLLFKLPVIKGPMAKIATSRFTRTLSMLLSSGVPLLDSLNAAANGTNNSVLIKRIDEVADNVRKGIALSTLLKDIEIFPPMMISMMHIGEESGSLEEMLDKSAEFYEEELDEAIATMTALIEPVMIVFMAGIVGFIVVAMLMPTFDIFSAVQGG